MFKLMDKKILTILRLFFCLSKPMEGEKERRRDRDGERRGKERERERENVPLCNRLEI